MRTWRSGAWARMRTLSTGTVSSSGKADLHAPVQRALRVLDRRRAAFEQAQARMAQHAQTSGSGPASAIWSSRSSRCVGAKRMRSCPRAPAPAVPDCCAAGDVDRDGLEREGDAGRAPSAGGIGRSQCTVASAASSVPASAVTAKPARSAPALGRRSASAVARGAGGDVLQDQPRAPAREARRPVVRQRRRAAADPARSRASPCQASPSARVASPRPRAAAACRARRSRSRDARQRAASRGSIRLRRPARPTGTRAAARRGRPRRARRAASACAREAPAPRCRDVSVERRLRIERGQRREHRRRRAPAPPGGSPAGRRERELPGSRVAPSTMPRRRSGTRSGPSARDAAAAPGRAPPRSRRVSDSVAIVERPGALELRIGHHQARVEQAQPAQRAQRRARRRAAASCRPGSSSTAASALGAARARRVRRGRRQQAEAEAEPPSASRAARRRAAHLERARRHLAAQQPGERQRDHGIRQFRAHRAVGVDARARGAARIRAASRWPSPPAGPGDRGVADREPRRRDPAVLNVCLDLRGRARATSTGPCSSRQAGTRERQRSQHHEARAAAQQAVRSCAGLTRGPPHRVPCPRHAGRAFSPDRLPRPFDPAAAALAGRALRRARRGRARTSPRAAPGAALLGRAGRAQPLPGRTGGARIRRPAAAGRTRAGCGLRTARSTRSARIDPATPRAALATCCARPSARARWPRRWRTSPGCGRSTA